MAGCDYLPNIEQIGLKVALKQLDKLKSFEAVMDYFESNKVYQHRIPTGYRESARRVAQLFQFQTVYDLRTRKLTQLSGNALRKTEKKHGDGVENGADLDLEFLGSHDAIMKCG